MYYNLDCVEGARKHLKDASVDLIVTDPPYGIGGDLLHKHYNRNENHVLEGYVEVPLADYANFSCDWIKEAERVLKPGGSMYIISGYSNLIHILNALQTTALEEVNHIIWRYNFGVFTKKKYISSHYHILYYRKPGAETVFNTYARFADSEKSDENGGSLNYQDREDVWAINREYKPGQVKNKNELPTQLLTKIIQYSSNPGDLVCDFFLGSFSTAKVAIGLERKACGFEINPIAFEHQMVEMEQLQPGWLLGSLRQPPPNKMHNQGKSFSDAEKADIVATFAALKTSGKTKKEAINTIGTNIGRGYWSILRIVDAAKQPK